MSSSASLAVTDFAGLAAKEAAWIATTQHPDTENRELITFYHTRTDTERLLAKELRYAWQKIYSQVDGTTDTVVNNVFPVASIVSTEEQVRQKDTVLATSVDIACKGRYLVVVRTDCTINMGSGEAIRKMTMFAFDHLTGHDFTDRIIVLKQQGHVSLGQTVYADKDWEDIPPQTDEKSCKFAGHIVTVLPHKQREQIFGELALILHSSQA